MFKQQVLQCNAKVGAVRVVKTRGFDDAQRAKPHETQLKHVFETFAARFSGAGPTFLAIASRVPGIK